MPQTVQQQRARFSLVGVESDRIHLNAKQRGEYKAYASELPAMIHMNGLGQAAAFYRSKAGTRLYLYKLMNAWLTSEGQPYYGHDDLLAGITQDNQHTYRLAQAEAVALMDWVKKFAKAFMEGEE